MIHSTERALDIWFEEINAGFFGLKKQKYFVGQYYSGIPGEILTPIKHISAEELPSILTKCGLDTRNAKLGHLLVRFRNGLTKQDTKELEEVINMYARERELHVQIRYTQR